MLDDEKCDLLFKSKYDGDFLFAYDNIADTDIVREKIELAKKYTEKIFRFYTFTAYDRQGRWDDAFWRKDIVELLERIKFLAGYRHLPYVTRYEAWKSSKYHKVYSTLAAWCAQPAFFKKKTLAEFYDIRQPKGSFENMVKILPQLEKYADVKFAI